MTNTLTSNENLSHSKSTEISFFKTFFVPPKERITIERLFELIKTGGDFKENIQKIRLESNKELRNGRKKLLPAVTVSGLFENERKASNLGTHSGFLQIDFDEVSDPFSAIELLKKDTYCYACFLSPSGNGVKLIVKIANQKNQHTTCFRQLENYYKTTYNFTVDKSCKDVSRLMFLSWDENIFVNENSAVWEILIADNKNKFSSLLESFQKRENFVSGNRNNFVFKLSLECYKANIKMHEVVQLVSEKFATDGFTVDEIERTVASAYKSKESVVKESKGEDQHTSYSLLKRAENYLERKYQIRLNEVSGRIEYNEKSKNDRFRELNENNIYRELQHQGISLSLNKITSLLLSDFVPLYNPFLNYFENLKPYDSKVDPDYIDKICSYLPVNDMERFRLHFRKMLVRCIACALEPTVFNKQVFVFVGEGQNTGKSTFCRWLCPDDLGEYLTEYVNTDKDGLIVLATNFLINMDELATLSKAEINSLKSFISKDKINIRLPFAKRSSVHPRRANFIGSTNNDEFLTDETGSVRWLCFELTGKLNFNYKKDIKIDDIWRQAYSLYKDDFEYQLTADEIKENEKVNNRYLVSSQEVQLIQKHFLPANRENGEFYDATDILNFIVGKYSHIKSNTRSIGKAMKSLGFARSTKYDSEKRFSNYGYFVELISMQN
ncbi:VapE domain-containing protein [Lacibacter sediminis]|uniref:Primase C-terminal domain-containing protein n=1 Tax=Lacibacter sediminis TaxID=2760713 RepID=A0A7G5XKX7_9BACT|nr:VapE domain-containing protein [Lacibacter sediminis]QNA46130.1 primase C-terminal domain-containing protein [Lacibacter sediminis]